MINLTDEMKSFLAACINKEGSGDHPCADKNNLQYFNRNYTLYCLNESFSKLNKDGKKLAVDILFLYLPKLKEK